jgi:DNA-binding MarR family transcriptional regulator
MPGGDQDGDGVEQVALGPLVDFVGFHLRLAQDSAFESFSREVRDIGFAPGRFAILSLINGNPGISQTSLSQTAGRDKSTLTPIINDLTKRGLIRRRRQGSDRRRYALYLTDTGRELLQQLMVRIEKHEHMLDRIVGNDKEVFIDVLRRIATELPDRK